MSTSQGALAGRTALITGGSGSITTGSALHMLRDGAAVLLMARTQAKLEAARDRLRAEVPDARVEIFAGDATKGEDVQAAVKAAYALQSRLDMLVAGVGGGMPPKPLLLTTEQEFRGVLDSTLLPAFIAIRHAGPLMRPGSAIVCISSMTAVAHMPWMGAYCSAKGAVEVLVRAAAQELGSKGIRVNAVRPGLTRNANSDKGIFGTPEKIAQFRALTPLYRPEAPDGAEGTDIGSAVRFLCGPESSWITGQSIAVDGGNTLRMSPDMPEFVRSISPEEFAKARAPLA